MALFFVSYSGSFLEGVKIARAFEDFKDARRFAREKSKTHAVVLIYKDGYRRENIIESYKNGRRYDKNGKLIKELFLVRF